MDKKTQTIQAYNSHAVEFAEKFDKLGIRRTDIDETFGLVGKDNPSVFEIGCGNGRDASFIITKTQYYHGIDASDGLISLAKQRVPEVQFEVADVVSYIFPALIDIIFAFASLIHIPREDLKKVFQKSYDSLNLGGIMRISMKSAESYEEIDITDDLGARTYFGYALSDLEDSLGNFLIVKTQLNYFAGSSWIDMTLKK